MYTLKNIFRILRGKSRHLLTTRTMRSLAEFMSDGGTHLFAAILVISATVFWGFYTVRNSNMQIHNISLGMSFIPANIEVPDTVSALGVTFILDSKEISDSTNGKYKSQIRIAFGTSGHPNTTRDTAIINYYSNPLMDDLLINQDSINYTGKNKEVKVDSLTTLIKTELVPQKFKTNVTITDLPDSTKQIKIIQAKNAKVPVINKWIEGTQVINIYSNKLGLVDDSPYYNYYINFGFYPSVQNTQHSYGYNTLRFQFGDLISKNDYYFNNSKQILFNYIYPEPDIINNGFIFYYTKEKLEAVQKNHGVIIQAEDVSIKNRNMRKSIIYSVLVGTGLAFFLDILVQLIRELRNLNRKSEKLYNSEEQQPQQEEKK